MTMENVDVPADLNEIMDRPDPNEAPSVQEQAPSEPTPAAPATPEAPAAPTVENQDQFPRDYVEQLRRESADRRVQLKPFEDAFGGYEPDEVETWLQLIRLTNQDPAAGAQYMAEIASQLKNQYSPPDPNTLTPEQRAQQVTQSEIEKFRAEQKEERERLEMERQVRELNLHAEKLGYEPGTSGYLSLLHYAQHKTGGDIDKAHEFVQADVQKIIDAYVASKQAAPPAAPGTGVGSPTPTEFETLSDSRDALSNWLDEINAGPAK